MTEVNVLFTSVGRRVELIRAFRKAFQDLHLAGRIIGTDIDDLAPAFQVVDSPVLVPPLSSPEYLPSLLEICNRERVHLIFPLIDPDIVVLAQNKKTLEDTGARLGVVSLQSATCTADKWETARFFDQIPVDSPRTWLPEQLDPQQINYPLFMKPRWGSAAKNTFQVQNEHEFRFFVNYIPNPIVQEFLPGPEITSDVICSLEGEVWSVVSRRRIEVRWGEVAKGVTVKDPLITDGCLKVAKALGAMGPITVQCIIKEGLPYFTEINARFAGGAPLAIAAGVDFPRWYLAEQAGLPFQIPPLGSYRYPFYMTRFDESFFLSQPEIRK